MDERPSKSERKRRSDDLQSLGEALIDLPDSEFNALPLPEALRDAVLLARKITKHGGLYRQKQYIGKLMRKIDAEPIRAALEARHERERVEALRFRRIEQWRDRLLQEGASAIERLAAEVPGIDVDCGHGPGRARPRGTADRRLLRSQPRTVSPAARGFRGLISSTIRRMKPLVGIIMGSKSDWDTLQSAADTLQRLGVPFETRVVSAHRTPDLLFEYAGTARERGLEVIIAGAGGAAHLPGMTAAKTSLPVLGVPVQSKALNGLDSLLSIVQMPAGIPVATLAIGVAGATNAALLAAAILANKYDHVRTALDQFRSEQTAGVLAQPLPSRTPQT